MAGTKRTDGTITVESPELGIFSVEPTDKRYESLTIFKGRGPKPFTVRHEGEGWYERASRSSLLFMLGHYGLTEDDAIRAGLVRRALADKCYCLHLLRDHRAGARGCEFNRDWTSR